MLQQNAEAGQQHGPAANLLLGPGPGCHGHGVTALQQHSQQLPVLGQPRRSALGSTAATGPGPAAAVTALGTRGHGPGDRAMGLLLLLMLSYCRGVILIQKRSREWTVFV